MQYLWFWLQDVQLTVSNDDQYFVFEDVIFQVMLCFSRDTEVHQEEYKEGRGISMIFLLVFPKKIFSRWPISSPAVRATRPRQCWEAELVGLLITWSSIHQGAFIVWWCWWTMCLEGNLTTLCTDKMLYLLIFAKKVFEIQKHPIWL